MIIAVNTDVGRDSVPEPLQTVSVSSPSLRYSYAPSDRQRIACNWKLADCYETATVLCRQSDISVSINQVYMNYGIGRSNKPSISIIIVIYMKRALVLKYFIRSQI